MPAYYAAVRLDMRNHNSTPKPKADIWPFDNWHTGYSSRGEGSHQLCFFHAFLFSNGTREQTDGQTEGQDP